MFGITIKNILKNKMLNLCLAFGFILSIAVVSAVPMYSDSVLDNYIKMIFKDADAKVTNQWESKNNTETIKKSDSTASENIKPENKNLVFDSGKQYVYPASLTLTKTFRFNADYSTLAKEYKAVKQSFYEEAQKIKLPVLAKKTTFTLRNIRYNYTRDSKTYYSSNNQIKYLEDYEKHIDLLEGRLPEGMSKDNTVEVIADKETMENFKLELNKPYEISSVVKENPLKMKIVGVFNTTSREDSFWVDKDNNFYCEFLTTENGFLNMLKDNEEYIGSLENVNFNILYDYNNIKNSNAADAYNIINSKRALFKNRADSTLTSTLSDNLKQYVDKESIYKTVVWMFLIPVLIVVIFYIWMVSGFIVEADSEQISVLKSRGGSTFEIMRLYLYEGLILTGIGLIAGPFLGALLSKYISYSNGFLIFSSAEALDISFSSKAYLYSLVTVIVLLITLLLSVYSAARKSIVEVKQSKNRHVKVLFKNKYMDIILLFISIYGYYNYTVNKNSAVLTAAKTSKAPLDPLLYLISTIFIIGAGMFLLRIYRYVVSAFFAVGKRRYSTPLYIALINVMRYHLKKIAAMLFIIITVSIGIFDMHISKDINTSYINTVKYTNGADFIVKGNFIKEVDDTLQTGDNGVILTTYHEPPYLSYSKIEGIQSFTKVLKAAAGSVSLGSGPEIMSNIMGIIPYEFGKTAYFDDYLLNVHWFNYLNAMTENSNYVLVSKGLANSSSLNKGDSVLYKLGPGLSIRGTVLDIVDYWPGYSNLQTQNLLIGNLDYIFKHTTLYPYEVWMRQKEGVPAVNIYNSIKKEDLKLTEFKSLPADMYVAKSDVFLKGTNAILNLSFLSIAAITVLGFVIYWMISLRSRTLSFGIYRSLGVSSKEITLTLILEQFLTLGASILIGLLAGNIVARMFLPLIKELWYKNKFVIPANNLKYLNEYMQLGALLIGIFFVSFGVLRSYIGKLKVNEAIKLGED